MSKKKKTNKEKDTQKNRVRVLIKHHGPQVIRIGVLGLVSLLIFVLSLYWLPGDLHYRITETYRFSGDEAGRVRLVVLLPTTGQYQDVFDPEVVWPGTVEITQAGRLQIVRLTADLQARETIEARVSYLVHLWQGRSVWFRDPANPADLAATPEIQSDHPLILAKAEALHVPNNQRRTARRIFEFTNRHLEWPTEDRINPEMTALSALQTGVGSGSDHAFLMAALSRAEGIPARAINGLALPDTIPFIPVSSVWDHPGGEHAWVETFFDAAWHFVDPSRANLILKHDLFGWIDGRRLAYDTVQQERATYQPLIAEAEANGTWIAAMNAPLRFVAWSTHSFENMRFTPEVTLQKVWDSRYLLGGSLTLIMLVLTWVAGENSRRKGGKGND